MNKITLAAERYGRARTREEALDCAKALASLLWIFSEVGPSEWRGFEGETPSSAARLRGILYRDAARRWGIKPDEYDPIRRREEKA